MVLRSDEMQLSRGESVRDTALVLSRHVAAIGIRTGPDELVAELARHASVPVINMLTAVPPPLSGARRSPDAEGDVRHAGRAEGRIRRRRQQRRPVAGDPRGPRGRAGDDRLAARVPDRTGGGRAAGDRAGRGRVRGRRAVHRCVGEHERQPRIGGRAPRARLLPTGSTKRCWHARSRRRSCSTASQRTRVRRSPKACCTATVSESGTRPRTAATRRRPCSSSWCRRSGSLAACPHLREGRLLRPRRSPPRSGRRSVSPRRRKPQRAAAPHSIS